MNRVSFNPDGTVKRPFKAGEGTRTTNRAEVIMVRDDNLRGNSGGTNQ